MGAICYTYIKRIEKWGRETMKTGKIAKDALLKALLELLGTKRLCTISISELCQKAGISRMTFYRHYSSIEQIIVDFHDELINNYKKHIALHAHGDKSISYENMVFFFRYFKQYMKVTRYRYENIPGKMLLDSITEFVLEHFDPEKGSRRYYEVLSYAGAICAVYLAWVENGAKETPEEIADVIYSRFRSWSG